MAYPTAVNSQITDAVTQTNARILGEAPALALGNLYQATAQALANAAHNATTAQQQAAITMQAATTSGITTLYSIDTASTGVSTAKIFAELANGPAPTAPVVAATASPATALGEQVMAAWRELCAAPAGPERLLFLAATRQVLVHALALGVHNAIAQQQHAGILRQALLTVGAKAILAGKKGEGEAVIQLAESKLLTTTPGEELAGLMAAIKALGEEPGGGTADEPPPHG